MANYRQLVSTDRKIFLQTVQLYLANDWVNKDWPTFAEMLELRDSVN